MLQWRHSARFLMSPHIGVFWNDGRSCPLAKRMPNLRGSMNFYERDGRDVAEGAAFSTRQSALSLSIITMKLR
jgi:hypothetical protein